MVACQPIYTNISLFDFHLLNVMFEFYDGLNHSIDTRVAQPCTPWLGILLMKTILKVNRSFKTQQST